MKEEKGIGCGIFDTENPYLTRRCGDILFSNKIWLCKKCRKKKYSKSWEKLIDRNEKIEMKTKKKELNYETFSNLKTKEKFKPKKENKTLPLSRKDVVLNKRYVKYENLVKRIKKNYDCYFELDLCGLWALGDEVEKLIESEIKKSKR